MSIINNKSNLRALNFDTLKDAGTSTSIVQKIDLFLGRIPSSIVSISGADEDWVIVNDASNIEIGQFYSLFSETFGGDRLYEFKSVVREIDGNIVYFYDTLPKIGIRGGHWKLGKLLVIRGSSQNCYREDEYGIKRFYPAIAGPSDVEANMGEMNEYEWNRSDYSFSIDNYDKRFNKYLQGGDEYISWAGRNVDVYIGIGESYNQNKLIFSGITHFNNGVSEEDFVLKITAYDKSYKYNVPALTSYYKNIENEDKIGEPIPLMYGDWYNSPTKLKNSGLSVPSIPATLVSSTVINTYPQAKVRIPAKDGVKTFVVKHKTYGTTGNGLKIKFIRRDFLQTELFDKQTAISYDTLNKIITIYLYQGEDSTGITYNSSAFIKNVIDNNTTVSALVSVEGDVDSFPMFDIPRNNYGYSNSYYSSNDTQYWEFELTGGSTTQHAEYSICANPLTDNASERAFALIAFCNGSFDDAKSWYTSGGNILYSHIDGTTVVPQWDWANGKVRVENIPGGVDLKEISAYVRVYGENIGGYKSSEDVHILMNVGHTLGDYRNNCSAFRAGPLVLKLPEIQPVPGFEMGEGLRLESLNIETIPAVARSCSGILWWRKCSGGSPEYQVYHWDQNIQYFYGHYMSNTSQEVFEVEFQIDQFPFETTQIAIIGNYKNGVFTNAIDIKMVDHKLLVNMANNSARITTVDSITVTKAYKLRVVKNGSDVRLYLKNNTDGTPEAEMTYSIKNSFPSVSYYIGGVWFGRDFRNETATNGIAFKGYIGTARYAVNTNTFQDGVYVPYRTNLNPSDPISIAREVLTLGGATQIDFDNTWDKYRTLIEANKFEARAYLADEKEGCVDIAARILGEIGIVLTMKADIDNVMKFSLIWDRITVHHKNDDYRITEFDIEDGSISIDREVNQYFNTARAKFSYSPALDELNSQTTSIQEPLAKKRDQDIEIWFKRADKGIDAVEFNTLYLRDDVEKRIKEMIAMSTPNCEFIELTLSWRHLGLQLGDYCTLNAGRYNNIPVQVRGIKLDANGSKIEVKLLSLESVKMGSDYADYGQEHTPNKYTTYGANPELTGGEESIASMIEVEDPQGDI